MKVDDFVKIEKEEAALVSLAFAFKFMNIIFAFYIKKIIEIQIFFVHKKINPINLIIILR